MAPSIAELRTCLLDLNQPIAKRTHAAFFLRTNGSHEAALAIADALQQRDDCPLMRHELAYILGQMQDKSIAPILVKILEDENDDVLVRHESAEAMGALNCEDELEILEKFSTHPVREISETCAIAVDLIKWRREKEAVKKSGYLSVDPAPPLAQSFTVDNLRRELMDCSKSLFHRYRAMFSLRDMNSDQSALALLDGFRDDSALFKHEVAYVLGQMQRSVTVDGLSQVLRDTSEHRMVRHEAAEALGAIGGSAAEFVLEEYMKDPEQVVNQSCEVALDTIDYWNQEFKAGC